MTTSYCPIACGECDLCADHHKPGNIVAFLSLIVFFGVIGADIWLLVGGK